MHEKEVEQPRECGKIIVYREEILKSQSRDKTRHRFLFSPAANCGAIENLLICSRCHTVWFCGVECQRVSPHFQCIFLITVVDCRFCEPDQ